MPAAIAAREREVAERERGAAASAFLESLDLPTPAAVASAVVAVASPAEGAAASATASEAADHHSPLENMSLARVRAASPALSGSSRRSSASLKRAAPEPTGLQDAGHDGAIEQLHDAAPHASAVTGLDAATQEQLQAELAVIQVRGFCSWSDGAFTCRHTMPAGPYVVLDSKRPQRF